MWSLWWLIVLFFQTLPSEWRDCTDTFLNKTLPVSPFLLRLLRHINAQGWKKTTKCNILQNTLHTLSQSLWQTSWEIWSSEPPDIIWWVQWGLAIVFGITKVAHLLVGRRATPIIPAPESAWNPTQGHCQGCVPGQWWAGLFSAIRGHYL